MICTTMADVDEWFLLVQSIFCSTKLGVNKYIMSFFYSFRLERLHRHVLNCVFGQCRLSPMTVVPTPLRLKFMTTTERCPGFHSVFYQ